MHWQWISNVLFASKTVTKIKSRLKCWISVCLSVSRARPDLTVHSRIQSVKPDPNPIHSWRANGFPLTSSHNIFNGKCQSVTTWAVSGLTLTHWPTGRKSVPGMWRSSGKTQSSSHAVCSKVHGRPKASPSLQHLSPFASHSAVDSGSPKSATELPSGIKYIRQPESKQTLRSVSGRRTPTESSRFRNRSISKERSLSRHRDLSVTRDKSPDKAVRFGNELKTRTDQVDAKNQTITKITPTERKSRPNFVRPVINSEPSSKTVATSPASRQASPIFSTINFEGDSKRTNGAKQSPLAESAVSETRDESPAQSQTSGQSTPLSTPESRSSVNRQPIVKTQITTPGGTVKRYVSKKSFLLSNVYFNVFQVDHSDAIDNKQCNA